MIKTEEIDTIYEQNEPTTSNESKRIKLDKIDILNDSNNILKTLLQTFSSKNGTSDESAKFYKTTKSSMFLNF